MPHIRIYNRSGISSHFSTTLIRRSNWQMKTIASSFQWPYTVWMSFVRATMMIMTINECLHTEHPLCYTTYPSYLPPRLYSQVVIEYYRLRPTSQIAIRYVGAGKFMTSVHVPLQSQLAILLWSRSISYCSSYSTVHTSNYPSCL